ncbi:amidohydrolase family protein [Phenylobacterium sp. J367]|uniref:amidohydrolase family protein n=1 Tax=Phenylobacterium sp. J367 TaxID=2898435 RepID=UPI0021508DFA|nr:amidohydrolase family protein [Phenylobacterium sp. J367]MCR5877391.1 amidohydrolase family protein [Phenylobacterium sp. J367]
MLQQYVKVDAPVVVLRGVRVIDGTGAAARENQTVVLDGGKIAAIGPASLKAPKGATVLDLAGHTVLPGLVGMHNHLFYTASPNLDAHGHSEPPRVIPEMPFTSPRMYLAAGVTTMRTTGSMSPYADLGVKKLIDTGKMIGPHLDVTGPYLDGAATPFFQIHPLTGPDDARRMVNYWADMGATSFKAYMHISRAELAAAIEEAHKRGIKVTGHLCSVSYPEAVAAGIDNLEHGFTANSQLDPDRKPDVCSPGATRRTLAAMQPDTPEADALIKLLVDNKVAVTSTLPVSEQGVPGHAPLDPRAMKAMTAEAREAYLYNRNLRNTAPGNRGAADSDRQLRTDMALQKKFFEAGGLLVAGPDPTGNGGVLPGFGDQRGVELLVEAGFTPLEAIRIATLNGATYLGLADRIGSLAVGKNADLVVVKGDPSKTIGDISKVEIVFKDGVGFDSRRVLDSVTGRYGQY